MQRGALSRTACEKLCCHRFDVRWNDTPRRPVGRRVFWGLHGTLVLECLTGMSGARHSSLKASRWGGQIRNLGMVRGSFQVGSGSRVGALAVLLGFGGLFLWYMRA